MRRTESFKCLYSDTHTHTHSHGTYKYIHRKYIKLLVALAGGWIGSPFNISQANINRAEHKKSKRDRESEKKKHHNNAQYKYFLLYKRTANIIEIEPASQLETSQRLSITLYIIIYGLTVILFDMFCNIYIVWPGHSFSTWTGCNKIDCKQLSDWFSFG